jgi:hypothetical protein
VGTLDEAKAGVFDYIERFYNARRRLHSTIGYMSPMEFEMKIGFADAGVNRTGSRPVVARQRWTQGSASLPSAVPAMCRNLAAARLRADCPFGNAPTTRVRGVYCALLATF